MHRATLAILGLLALPAAAHAAGHDPLDLPAWSVTPFALLLLAVAVLPAVAGRFWHNDRNKALVVAALVLPLVAYLAYLRLTTGKQTLYPLAHELAKYASFIILLGSLYVVSGGLVVRGEVRPTPAANTAILAFGSLLANVVGTTGASVLLIRPLLRVNRARRHTAHLPVFFIFTVGNLGGLLTPLGDPPLFMGFLNGVPFTWTLRLWPEWLVANGAVLSVFFAWDSLAARREKAGAWTPAGKPEPVRLEGSVNLPLLAGILAAVVFEPTWPTPWDVIGGEVVMLTMGLLSLWLTPKGLRAANDFTWAPLVEVAVLFAGIFVTMVPALDLLAIHGRGLGLTRPWHYFWLTGVLSSWLDNAPTYLAFATLAAGGGDFAVLVDNRAAGLDGPHVLAAVSCGAVLMGALTYVGNGPNFMVKAIADHAGYRTPSFLGYLLYSSAVLLPVFALITLLFFRAA